jgi:hypothetical protein
VYFKKRDDTWQIESLSVRHQSDNSHKQRISGTCKHTDKAIKTLSAKNSYGLRLFKVNGIYYYRRTIKRKDCKISLRTRDFKTALMRRNIFNMMSDGEFMFTFEKGDYKFVFEYETMDELREGVQLAKETYEQLHQDLDTEALNKTMQIFEHIDKTRMTNLPANQQIADVNENITFAELEIRFLASKRKAEKVGESTYKAYATAFDKLKRFFKGVPIRKNRGQVINL